MIRVRFVGGRPFETRNATTFLEEYAMQNGVALEPSMVSSTGAKNLLSYRVLVERNIWIPPETSDFLYVVQLIRHGILEVDSGRTPLEKPSTV